MVAIPEYLTPRHAASNLRLFVETCAQGSTDLVAQVDEDGVVGKDPERSWRGLATLALSQQLPEGRHYYFDASACGAIAGYAENMSDETWSRLSRQETHWDYMPGASFLTFANPHLGASEWSGPLLSAALLPSGVVGFLGATDDEKPVVKIVPWNNGESWKQLLRNQGPDRDPEIDHWGAILLVAMELGPTMDHADLELRGEDLSHRHFIMTPKEGFIQVSAKRDPRVIAWDGQWKGRLN